MSNETTASNEQEPATTAFEPQFVRNMVESFLRIGLLVVLLMMSYDIIQPFIVPILWGAIIAVAAMPLVRWLEPKLGGKRGLAATVVSLVFILLLVVPTWMVTESALGGLKKVATAAQEGTLAIPPPPAKVANLPMIGDEV